MDKIDEKIRELLSQRLDTPNHYIISIKNAFHKPKYKHNSFELFKIVATTFTCIIATTSIAFATKNYITSNFGLGKGIETATNNGYIENINMDYVHSNIFTTNENISIEAKVVDFLMDNKNISIHFDFKFLNNLLDFDVEKYKSINLKDLIVTDENNRILFCNNKATFEDFCEKNQLSYAYGKFNENYMSNGFNSFINKKYDNQIIFTYNIFTSETYPKSQKIKIQFNNVELIKEDSNIIEKSKTIDVQGNWNITLDVPNIMYNRNEILYEVVNCSNDNFQVTNAKLSETGFEFGVIISNIKRTDNNIFEKAQEILGENTQISIPISEERKWNDKNFGQWHPIYDKPHQKELGEDYEDTSYVENENGDKFEISNSLSREQNHNFIDGDKYEYYETFALTKYDLTYKLKVSLLYNGSPVTFELKQK